jgi:acyl dehydratase
MLKKPEHPSSMKTLLASHQDISSLGENFEWTSEPFGVTLEWNLQFGELVGDLNEVHVHPERSKRFRSHLGNQLVRQGSGTFSQAISQVLHMFEFEEPVEIILMHSSATYLRPARNGDFIAYRYEMKEAVREEGWTRVGWKITATNQKGKEILVSSIEVRYYKAILR